MRLNTMPNPKQEKKETFKNGDMVVRFNSFGEPLYSGEVVAQTRISVQIAIRRFLRTEYLWLSKVDVEKVI